MKNLTGMWIVLGLVLAMAGCAARQIYFVPDCDERLAIPYKRMECRACVERPIPHEFLPDNPDDARCVRR
jgi:hypothetical protein